MQDNIRKYYVQPKVYQTGKPSKVTLYSTRLGSTFKDTDVYKIYVVPMAFRRDLDYAVEDLTVRPVNGVITFDFTFTHECEYEIRFSKNDEPKQKKANVYAVAEDLYKLRPLRGDFHVHSNRSDGRDDPAEVVSNYRKKGFDFLVLTDHNRYFPSIEANKCFEGVKTDLVIINGEELHTPITNLHIVHAGGKKSVAERYVKHRAEYEAEVAEIENNLPELKLEMTDGVPLEHYRNRLAKAIWATKNVHEAGGIAILPHPFWIKNIYNVSLTFLELLFKYGNFDAYEITGCMGTDGDNLSLEFYNEMRSKGFSISLLCNSDSHSTIAEYQNRFSNFYSIVFAEDNTPDSILDAVRKGYSAAVETNPQSLDEKEYRVHSNKFRIVMYTRFLLDHYFQFTKELFDSEGYFMRSYYLGVEGAKEVLDSLSGRGDKFYNAFFGRTDDNYFDLAPSKKLYKEYDAVWEEYGIDRRGSDIDPGVHTIIS